jgi:SAM-dependent methyltransferase
VAALTPRRRGFDRLAGLYRWLEWLAFGRTLERARFSFLEELRDCRSILLLGEGDGRCLARLVRIAPQAQIHCVDASGAMLARAAARLAGASRDIGAAGPRVTFEHGDILTTPLASNRYDGVATFFFLDCFTPSQVDAIVADVRRSLTPDARWLFADFALPAGGFARWRARVCLAGMYAFFRWQTGLAATQLPPSEDALRRHGWHPIAEHTFRGGFVRSAVYQPARTE